MAAPAVFIMVCLGRRHSDDGGGLPARRTPPWLRSGYRADPARAQSVLLIGVDKFNNLYYCRFVYCMSKKSCAFPYSDSYIMDRTTRRNKLHLIYFCEIIAVNCINCNVYAVRP